MIASIFGRIKRQNGNYELVVTYDKEIHNTEEVTLH